MHRNGPDYSSTAIDCLIPSGGLLNEPFPMLIVEFSLHDDLTDDCLWNIRLHNIANSALAITGLASTHHNDSGTHTHRQSVECCPKQTIQQLPYMRRIDVSTHSSIAHQAVISTPHISRSADSKSLLVVQQIKQSNEAPSHESEDPNSLHQINTPHDPSKRPQQPP